MLPSVSPHTTQSADPRRYLTSEAMTNPHSVAIQRPYLLGQQLPTISKFIGENLDGDGETFLEWVKQFKLHCSCWDVWLK